MIEIKWYARGGQGGFTACKLLGLTAMRCCGQYAQAFPSFGPERRGAPVYGFTRMDQRPIRDHSQLYAYDYAIVLDGSLLETIDVTAGLRPGGTIYLNTRQPAASFPFADCFRVRTFDASGLAQEVLGANITNTAMLAVFVADQGLADSDGLCAVLQEGLPPRVAAGNIDLVRRVFQQLAAVKEAQ